MRPSCAVFVFACGFAGSQVTSVLAGQTYYSTKAGFVAATNPVVVEDFENAPAEQILASLTRPVGTFSPYAGEPAPNVYINLASYTNFGVPGPIGTRVITANGDEDFELFLATPTKNVGFDTYLNEFGPATIRLYGAGHQLLDTYLHDHDSTKVGFFGVVSDVALTSIRWTTSIGRSVNTGYDNILIGTACVGDLNHDGFVDDSDFVIFAGAYNLLDCADPSMAPGCPADLNADGFVDDADFVIFIAAYNALLCE
ncbi:MAG: hypothetical protein KF805_06415 [Phycisphaeraceae bacterium]|nr:hypothetical protein [Phycisphaeraceae bacterium]